jgi:hypothetical protein
MGKIKRTVPFIYKDPQDRDALLVEKRKDSVIDFNRRAKPCASRLRPENTLIWFCYCAKGHDIEASDALR